MARNRMINYESYEKYLASDKWDEVKQAFKDSPQYEEVCFFCYTTYGLQCHHFRYPKDWNKDSHKNLCLCCKFCHERVHATRVIHDSNMYGPDDLPRYLSHLFKELILNSQEHDRRIS